MERTPWIFSQQVTNEVVTQEELGGARTHTTVSGEQILPQLLMLKV